MAHRCHFQLNLIYFKGNISAVWLQKNSLKHKISKWTTVYFLPLIQQTHTVTTCNEIVQQDLTHTYVGLQFLIQCFSDKPKTRPTQNSTQPQSDVRIKHVSRPITSLPRLISHNHNNKTLTFRPLLEAFIRWRSRCLLFWLCKTKLSSYLNSNQMNLSVDVWVSFSVAATSFFSSHYKRRHPLSER